MRQLSVLLIGLLCLVGVPRIGAADDVDLALAYCHDMEADINTLADFTSTRCLPSRGDSGMSFIFISAEPVFASPAAKKAWLLVVVASFGSKFNNNTMKSDEVFVSDVNLLGRRIGYRMPAPTARKLQRQVKANQIDLESMYRQVLGALQEFAVPQ